MTPIDALPDDARIWVFASNRELTPADETRVGELMSKVLGVWRSKAPLSKGFHEIRERRFLVVGADESAECLSGCSVDAMMAWILRLESESGLRLVDRMSVHWRDADGCIRSSGRDEFREMLAAGAIGPETRVFDTTISRAGSLRAGRFELPLRDSWHAELFPGARAAPN